MSDLLHLFFGNSGVDLVDAIDYEQERLFLRGIASQRKSKAIENSADLTEAGKVLDVMLGKDGESARKEIFEGNSAVKAANEFKQTINEASKDIVTDGDIIAAADKAYADLNNFATALQNYVEQMWDLLGNSSSFNQYKTMVINNYARTKTAPVDNLSQEILQSFLSKQGLRSLGSEKTVFLTNLRNLTLLASALPNLSKGQIEEVGGGDLPKIFKTILGKVRGANTGIVGYAGEIAALIAQKKGNDLMENEIVEKNEAIDSMPDVTVTPTGQNLATRHTSTKTYKVQQKGDIVINATSNGVRISYGISVKNYSVDPNAPSTSVSLGQGNDFLYLANLAGYSDYDVANMAAGHGIDDPSIPEFSGKHNIKKSITSGQIDSSWEKLKQIVAMRNFLMVFGGWAETAGDNVLLLVVNGSEFTIDELVDNITNESMDFLSASLRNGRGTELNRSTFVAINKFYTRKGDAERYDSTNYNKVLERLRKTKLKITLNFLAGMI